MKKLLLFAAILTLLFACKSDPQNIFDADEKMVQVYDAQLTGDTSALIAFLDDPEVKYRDRAAMLMGGMYSEQGRLKLEKMLTDTSWKVRKSAAYALGQYGKDESLEPVKIALEKESNPETKAILLEAFGKIGDVRNLKYLTQFPLENDKEIEGWAYGMYRLGVFSVNSIEKAIDLYRTATDSMAKRAIAFYLGDTRTGDYRTMQAFDKELQSLANETTDPIDKSYLITAQQSISIDKKLDFLQQTYVASKSPLVRYRCVQQLCFTPEGSFLKGIARRFLQDSSLHIRLNVMDWLAATADSSDVDYFRKGLDVEGNELLLVKLFKGWLNATGGSDRAIRATLANTDRIQNLQARADIYALLTKYADRYADLLLKAAYQNKVPVVTYRIVDGIKSHYKDHRIPDSVKQSIAVNCVFMIKSDNDPMMVYGAELLADTNIKAYEFVMETNWLDKLIQQETKPRVEYALKRVLYAKQELPLDEKEYYIAPFAEPNWDEIKEIPEKLPVIFQTNKGNFKMELYVENAPMSTWRFWDLCRSGYYDTSAIHRVVYPHVIQGGSQFGDGYNDDLAPIMTETTFFHFDQPGLVGFASDGRNTETGQFFVTHLPRPHLDENFTIFAKVTEGLDVINAIHKGDYVLNAEIKK